MDFSAESDEDTLYNPTSHAYFNPAGIDTDARELTLQLKSPRHLEFREDQIPTGKLLETAGTPFDVQTPAKIGDKIAEMNGAYDAKFDDAFELVYEAGTPSAIVTDEKSGRAIEMTTDRNAVIFFITNPAVADHEGDLDWFEANPYNAVALEAQTLSDAIHHPEFGDIVLHTHLRICNPHNGHSFDGCPLFFTSKDYLAKRSKTNRRYCRNRFQDFFGSGIIGLYQKLLMGNEVIYNDDIEV